MKNIEEYVKRREEAWEMYFFYDRESKFAESHMERLSANMRKMHHSKNARFYDGLINSCLTDQITE